MNHKIESWVFRSDGERFALFVGICISLFLAYVFSSLDFWLFIFLLVLGLIYLKLNQAQQLGNSIRVHQKQFPELYEIFKKHATELEIPKANLYIKQDPYLNAFTLGFDTCTVILNSALVEQLTEKELSFVIGHELGHYKAGHTKITSIINPLGQGNVFSNFIFGFWGRKAEYTCDRCGLLLTKDIDSGISSLLKMALGGNLFHKFEVEGYLPQLKHSDTSAVRYSEMLVSHPTTANRIRNLLQYWSENFISKTK